MVANLGFVIVPAAIALEPVLEAFTEAGRGAGLDELWVEVAEDVAVAGTDVRAHRFMALATKRRCGDLALREVARPLSRAAHAPVLVLAHLERTGIASYEVAVEGAVVAAESVVFDHDNEVEYLGTISRGVRRWVGDRGRADALGVHDDLLVLEDNLSYHHLIAGGDRRREVVEVVEVMDDDVVRELGVCFLLAPDPLASLVFEPSRLDPMLEQWLDELRDADDTRILFGEIAGEKLGTKCSIDRYTDGTHRLEIIATITQVIWNPIDPAGSRSIKDMRQQEVCVARLPVEYAGHRIRAIAGATTEVELAGVLRDRFVGSIREIKARLASAGAADMNPHDLIWGPGGAVES